MFTFIQKINDINRQINNAPMYYYRVLNIDGNEYWLQYNHMSFKQPTRYEISGIIMGCAAVQLIRKEEDNLFSVFKYNGKLIINRHLVNNIIDDTIENLQELETDIHEFFGEI